MIGPAISASGTAQILVATKPVDFRKQADSLAALVQEALVQTRSYVSGEIMWRRRR